MRRAAAAIWGAVAVTVAAACAACVGNAPPCVAVPAQGRGDTGAFAACPAVCPRDAAPNAGGRCACTGGTTLVLGACVAPAVGDAYCGAAARMSADGCVFLVCGPGETLDVATGTCVAEATIAPARACQQGTSSVVAGERFACVSPDAKCPRGSRVEGNACARPPRCPAGALPVRDAGAGPAAAASCVSVVRLGPHGGHVVDVGEWATLVLGADGGPGTEELCRPLAQRPDAFDSANLEGGESAPVRIRISLTLPDQDVTRVHARVQCERVAAAAASAARRGGNTDKDADAGAEKSGDEGTGTDMGTDKGKPPAAEPLSPAAQAVAEAAVESLLEPLRGLGGEASAAEVKVEVRCALSPRQKPDH